MNNAKTTTDLSIIRNPNTVHRFTWGRILTIHEVGRYTIVEFFPRIIPSQNIDSSKTEFHVYVDGKNTSISAGTFDQALVTAVAYGNIASPNQALNMAHAAMKVLDIASNKE